MLRTISLLSAGACLFAASIASAQELPPLFDGEAAAPPSARRVAGHDTVRERSMSLGAAWRTGLPGPGLTRIDLFADTTLTADVASVTSPGPGRSVASGRVAGNAFSSFTLARDGKVLYGTLIDPFRGSFELTSSDGRTVRVREVDLSVHRPCGGTLTGQKFRRSDAAPATLAAPPPSAGSVTVDVAVVYTTDAAAGAGGTNILHAQIDAAVAQANSAMSNSAASVVFRLVYRGPVAYVETGDMSLDLNRLTFEDGYMDEALCLRDRYGADQVALITENGNFGGLAWIMCSVGNVDPFSVSRRDQLAFYVLAHELGHNFGCDHDRDNPSGCRVHSYSWGHRFLVGTNLFKTIMSYNPGQTVPYFSTPNATFLGVPVGVAAGLPGEAHNARSISNTAPFIAAFRASVTPTLLPPPIPVNMSATPIQTNVLRVTWDPACEATGYRVFRHGVQVAVVTSNGFVDTGLAVNSQYCYRVVATNTAGASPTSAIACATTPTVPPFLLDGVEDRPGYLVSNPGMQIYAAVRSQQLYVATWSPGDYPGDTSKSDHFIFVATQVLASASRVAPWAKSGMVAAVEGTPFVAGESQNDYAGWDGASGSVIKTPQNSGKMEGVLDLVAEFGQMPTAIFVSATAYGTLDGGTLAAQAPAGSGPNLDPNEYLALALPSLRDINADGVYDRADPNLEFVQSDVRLGASGNAVITWAAVPGRVYAVSAAPTPLSAWTPLGTVTAQTLQTVMSFTNNAVSFTSATFRVQILPAP